MNTIKNKYLLPGTFYYAKAGQTPPGSSFIKDIEEALQYEGYPTFNGCCDNSTPLNGQVLVYNSTTKKLEFQTVSGVGGSVTGVTLGTTTAIFQQIVVTGGTNFNLPLATSTLAGLYNPTHYSFVSNLITNGLNSTQSVTGNGLVATPFKLVNDSTSPGNSMYYGTNALGVKGYFALPSGSSVSDLDLGTLTSTTNQITNTNGTGVTLNAVTSLVAGLATPSMLTAIDNKLIDVNPQIDGVTDTQFVKVTGIAGASKITDLNIKTMVGSTGLVIGKHGLVPTPGITDNLNFLRGDGTWAAVVGGAGATNLTYTSSGSGGTVNSDTGTDAIIPDATSSIAGLLPSLDKQTLINLPGIFGVSLPSSNMGSFTGTTITDTSSIKVALQDLETAVETKQDKLQFKDEGVNTGALGSVTNIDFVGSTVAATQIGNTLTVTLSGSASGATNLTLTNQNANTLDVVSDTGTDVTLPQATTSLAGLLNNVDKTQLVALPTLFGVTTGSTNMGTFTGTTVTDNASLKTIIQDLESATETKQAKVQYFDESVSLGATGTATSINFVGAGVTATQVGSNVTVTIPGGGGANTTNLTYTASPTNGIVNSDTGTDATIPVVDLTNAGLITPTQVTTFTAKQAGVQYQDEGVNLGTSGTVDTINVVGTGIVATRVGNTLTLTSNSSGIFKYDAGNGTHVKASGLGVTFVRTTASVWTFSIPSGVELLSFTIISTAGENPGAGLTLAFNYASNVVTNTSLITADVPTTAAWNWQSGATAQSVTGGTASSAFRPAGVTASGGNLSLNFTMGANVGALETLIKGHF